MFKLTVCKRHVARCKQFVYLINIRSNVITFISTVQAEHDEEMALRDRRQEVGIVVEIYI